MTKEPPGRERRPCAGCGRPTLPATLERTEGYCRRCRPARPKGEDGGGIGAPWTLGNRTPLSLAEITGIETAFDLGAPTLGLAVRKLEERWEAGLRDEETRLRLAFLAWYGAESPQVEHGLEPPLPLPADLLLGDEARAAGLSAEACFVTGYLAWFDPWAFAREGWEELHHEEHLRRATERDPESLLFANWRFLVGETTDPEGLRRHHDSEVHARFHGRGALGRFLADALTFV